VDRGTNAQPHELLVAPKQAASLTVEKVAGIINQLCPNVQLKSRSIAWLVTVNEGGKTGSQAPPAGRAAARRVLSSPAPVTSQLEAAHEPPVERAEASTGGTTSQVADNEPGMERPETPICQVVNEEAVSECHSAADTPICRLVDVEGECADTPISSIQVCLITPAMQDW
jgi:hypothetical protein